MYKRQQFNVFNTDFDFSGGSFKLYLIDSANTVLDACSISPGNVESFFQAYPNGSGDFYLGFSGTKNASNDPERYTNVVINELMVEPPMAKEMVNLLNCITRVIHQ